MRVRKDPREDVMRGAVAIWLKHLEWHFGFVCNLTALVVLICLAAHLGDCVGARTSNQDQVEVIRASQPTRHPGIVCGHRLGAFDFAVIVHGRKRRCCQRCGLGIMPAFAHGLRK